MQAFTIQSQGSAAQLADIDLPEPGTGQVRIAIKACGLNFADLLMQKGTY